MIERLERVDPQSAADDFTAEYVEVTVEEALEDLNSPGAGDFFGRIDTHDAGGETWYIGRRHIEDDAHDPVVVDWRAPIAAPFYRATGADPLGVDLRRRFMLDEGELTAYLDEHLDDPDAADVAGGIPDPVLAEIGAERTGAMREIVATIQAEQDFVIRAPDGAGPRRAGRAGHGQDGGGPAPRRLPPVRAPPPPRPRRRARDRTRTGRSSTTSATSCRRSASAACARRRRSTCACRRSTSPASTTRLRPGPRATRRCSTSCSWRPCSASSRPTEDVVVPIGVRRIVFTGGRDRRVARPRRRRCRAVQPAAPSAAVDRPAGAAPAHRRRRRVERRRAVAQGARRGVADAAADQARRPVAAGAARQEAGVDGGRPAARRRGQLDPQRPAARLRPRRRRRGPGPLGRRPARHRPAQPGGVDDARGRRRPVDDAGRAGALGRRVRLPLDRRQRPSATSPS